MRLLKRKKALFVGFPLMLIVFALAYYQLFYISTEVNSGIFKPDRTFIGHTAPVWAARFSPDGKLVASGSVDSTVRMWERDNGQVIHVLKHPIGVTNLAYSSDGKFLATSCYDGIIRIWDAGTGSLVKTLGTNGGTVWSLAFSPDGKTIVSGGEDKLVKLWDVQSGKFIRSLGGHTLNIWCVKFSPDGSKIASGSFDSTLKIWDVANGTLLKTITEHTEAIVDLAFNHNGETLATTSDDKTIRLWSTSDFRLIRTMKVPEHVQAVAFSPDDKYLVTGGRDKPMMGEFLQNIFGDSNFNKGVSARFWDIKSGTLMQTFRRQANDVNDVDYSSDGKWLVTASADNTVQLWRLTKNM